MIETIAKIVGVVIVIVAGLWLAGAWRDPPRSGGEGE